MRFVDTTSWKFREVSDRELPRLKGGYAILSHRWTSRVDEIQYTDILSMDEAVKTKGGFAKFAGACALAKGLGNELIWIDTCCINKQDSAELGEAINSMYRWYSITKVCLAYLQDVTSDSTVTGSEWFARGWTLQELIASTAVRFYDSTWEYLGDKSSLSTQILGRTGIPADVPKNAKPPRAYSIAQRMSWAAERTTTRLEDRAYSLMGLFDVNMAIIYGEREQAFTRLQEHIIAKSADESIFLWDLGILEDSTRDARQVTCGLLAPSPASFATCGDITAAGRSLGFHINQFGVVISSPATFHTLEVFQVPLKVKNGQAAGDCAILLVRLPGQESFARVSTPTGESFVMTEQCGARTLEFRVPLDPIDEPVFLYHGFWLRKLDFQTEHIASYTTFQRRNSEHDRLLLPTSQTGTAGIIRLSLRGNGPPDSLAWIKLGFDAACRPVCCLMFPSSDYVLDTLRMAKQARSLEAPHPSSPQQLNVGLGRPERVHHQFFNDDWITSPRQVSTSTSGSYYDPQKQGYAHGSVSDFVYKAKEFTNKTSAELVPDMSPTTSINTKQEVWAVEIIADEAPPRTWRGDAWCC